MEVEDMNISLTQESLNVFHNLVILIWEDRRVLIGFSILFLILIFLTPRLWEQFKYLVSIIMISFKESIIILFRGIQWTAKSCYMFVKWSAVEEENRLRIEGLTRVIEKSTLENEKSRIEFKEFQDNMNIKIENLTNRVVEAEKKVYEQDLLIKFKDALILTKDSEIKKLKQKTTKQ